MLSDAGSDLAPRGLESVAADSATAATRKSRLDERTAVDVAAQQQRGAVRVLREIVRALVQQVNAGCPTTQTPALPIVNPRPLTHLRS
jgi:hypothetical protein